MAAGQQGSEHTLVDVELQNGRSATIDLGPNASPEKIGLDEGDSITVRGKKKQVQGRDVLSAQLLRIDGEKVSAVSG